MKHIFRLLLCMIAISGGAIHADNCLQESAAFNHEVMEEETLIFKALVAAEVGNAQDMRAVAKQAVSTCYNAQKQSFDNRVLQRWQELISIGAGSSSAYNNVPIEYAKYFAEAIINQTSSISQLFSPADRQTFWGVVGQEVKRNLSAFCSEHGCKSTGDLNSHIDNIIQMKKTFG